MSNKHDIFAITVPSPTMSEAFQRIAFSFGYKWPITSGDPVKPNFLTAKYIYFNTRLKQLTWGSDLEYIDNNKITLVFSVEALVTMLSKPPVTEVKLFNGVVTIHKDGKVVVQAGDKRHFTSEEFEKVVKERADFLNS